MEKDCWFNKSTGRTYRTAHGTQLLINCIQQLFQPVVFIAVLLVEIVSNLACNSKEAMFSRSIQNYPQPTEWLLFTIGRELPQPYCLLFFHQIIIKFIHNFNGVINDEFSLPMFPWFPIISYITYIYIGSV